jgi:hypothetical protein
MRAVFAFITAAMLAAALPVGSATAGDHPAPRTAGGRQLAAFLDGLDVESLWIRNYHIDWRTGVADGPEETTPGGHTHCSAFVAAAADRLGIYILRPPEHKQMFLANAQERWLNGAPGTGETAAAAGWRRLGQLADPGVAVKAVSLANKGDLVVAVYFQPPELTADGPKERPGHAAIVRPSDKSVAAIERDGPDVIQAGMHNHRLVAMKTGFASHKEGWRDGTIEFFVHMTGFAAASGAD